MPNIKKPNSFGSKVNKNLIVYLGFVWEEGKREGRTLEGMRGRETLGNLLLFLRE